jgi:hypothetical protein
VTSLFPQLQSRAIMQDRGYPGGHFGLPLELIQVRIGSEKSILNCVFGVRDVPEDPVGLSAQKAEAG